MKEYSTTLTIGVDLGNKKHDICILNNSGKIIEQTCVENTQDAISEYFDIFTERENKHIIMEAGTHSPWIDHLLRGMGFDVVVGNPRKLRAIWQTDYKDDKRDAHMLARMGRFDTNLIYPIQHRNIESYKDLSLIKCRDNLVKSRAMLVNSVRGQLKSQGIILSSSSTNYFATKSRIELPDRVYEIFSGILDSIDFISKQIKEYDKQIERKCIEDYPEAIHLRQIKGVGPITALAFILTLEEHGRFKKSRDVGAFLGLVPRKDQSGSIDKQLGITKSGDVYLRRMLIISAQYILGNFGEDCDLRNYGLAIAERGGGITKKKAVVAVARKLAVLMHSMWKSGEEYEPLRKSKKKVKKVA